MNVLHICELGPPLVRLTAFILICSKRTCDYSNDFTSPKRFYAIGCRRIAKTEIADVHRTVPERHYDGIKTAPRKRLQPGSKLHFAFWQGNYSMKLNSCESEVCIFNEKFVVFKRKTVLFINYSIDFSFKASEVN